MIKNNLVLLILCISLVLIIGFISGMTTAKSISGWYSTLNKPSFNPPNYLFGPVWTLLYILMGISLFFILKSAPSSNRTIAIVIFSIQLILNFFWSLIFFRWESPGIALIEIIVMWVMILLMIVKFHSANKFSAYLQIPYLLWVSFASVLNFFIWKLN